jgi:hypothetical protein
METIPFYTLDISINVHSTSYEPLLNKTISLEQFQRMSNSTRFSLSELDNGDLLYKDANGDFIQGHEV